MAEKSPKGPHESARVRLVLLAEVPDRWDPLAIDPGTVMTTCANCGAAMIERKCKLICRCGYFLSCSDCC